jgi:hypothetical protein
MRPTLQRILFDSPALDPDTRDYGIRVQIADGTVLEPGVVRAYDRFIQGCKQDGNWAAIRAACILAGARTLAGGIDSLGWCSSNQQRVHLCGLR